MRNVPTLALVACLAAPWRLPAAAPDPQLATLRATGSGPFLTFSTQRRGPHAWLRLRTHVAHQVAVFAELQDPDGQVLGYLFADGLRHGMDGNPIEPGAVSDWVDFAPWLPDAAPKGFRLRGLFDNGKQVSGWTVKVQAYTGHGMPPPPVEAAPRINWPARLVADAGRYVRGPASPYRDWIDATSVIQPWCGVFSEAMILDRASWIPKLRDEFGFGAIIFIPPSGDIPPNYSLDVYRQTVADYHAAGMKVIMYWSIMHVGHHDAWHEVTNQHPEWAQRDAAGKPISTYGDLWLCPSTGALQYCIDLGTKLLMDLDVDGIMLDNNGFGKTDDGGITCCCTDCTAAFFRWTQANVPPEVTRGSAVRSESGRTPRPDEPLYPYWREWRYLVWAEADEAFRQAVRLVKPGAILCANTQFYGDWTLAAHGQYANVDLIFSESRNRSGASMSMKLLYAHSLSRGNPVWNYLGTWVPDEISQLLPAGVIEDAVCTSLARAASPWIVGYGCLPHKNRPGWRPARYDSERLGPGLTFDSERAADGGASARLALDQPGRTSVYQTPFLPVAPGTRYEFRCSVREEDVRPGTARVRFTFVDDAHKAPAGKPFTFWADASGGTHDWQGVRHTDLVAPEGATLLNVEAFLWGARGTAWFDDMHLRKAGSDENLLVNPSFEVHEDPEQATALRALQRALMFGRSQRPLLRGLVPYTNVAVLASRRSTDYAGRPRIPFAAVRALLAGNVGHELIGDEQLTAEWLARYDALILESAVCMSQTAVTAVVAWVRAGGGVIIYGETASRDEFGHVCTPGRLPAALEQSPAGMRSMQAVGSGKGIWVEGDAEQLFAEDDRGFVQALGQMVVDMGGGLVQVLSADRGLEVAAFCQPASRRLVITIDNQGETPEPGELHLRIPVPAGWGRKVRRIDLDGSSRAQVEYVDGGLEAKLPSVRRLALLVVE